MKKCGKGESKKEVIRTKKGNEETFTRTLKRQRGKKKEMLREARQSHLLFQALISISSAP